MVGQSWLTVGQMPYHAPLAMPMSDIAEFETDLNIS